MPSTRPDGDLYIAIGYKDDDPAWSSVPTEWGTAVLDEVGTSDQTRLSVWMWEGSSEPATYSISHDSEVTAFHIIRVSGANNSDPIDVSNYSLSSGSNASVGNGNTSTTVDECLCIAAICVDRDNVTAAPSGGTGPLSYTSGNFGGGGGAAAG